MSAALVVDGVCKRYGSRVALDRLSFEVPAGGITGLVGANGAGKTTCFGIVAGLLKPDTGRVDVLGRGPFQAQRHAGLLGMLPQDAELAPHARVVDLLVYFARLQGMSRTLAAREAARVLELLALGERARSRVRELSHGMRRRVAVAQALLGKPELVLLDEPTSGLDPHLVVLVRDVLRAERARGCSLLVSSHVLSDLEAVCDHVVFIEAGRVIDSGSLAGVTGRTQRVYFTLDRELETAALAERLPELRIRLDGTLLEIERGPALELAALNRRVLQALFELDAGVLEVRLGHSLEQAYMQQRERAGTP
ncbi:MAG TPA: ABC transporter ATP-binding protein [Polyangiales bacterium]|nr:ABC transporter ATP-binding protein [Polyangiales bacterium]